MAVENQTELNEPGAVPNSETTPDAKNAGAAKAAGSVKTKIPYGIGLTLIICASLDLAISPPVILTTALGVSMEDLFNFPTDTGNLELTASKMIRARSKNITLLSQIGSLGLTVYALVAGIGLKGYRRKGLRHARLWAKSAVFYLVLMQLVFFLYTLPLNKAVYAELHIPDHRGMVMVVDLLRLLFTAALPVVVWILLSGKKVETACGKVI